MSISVEYLVVAGGASGGATGAGGGGGGAGGVLTATTNLSTQTNYTITVGAGGASWSSGAGYDSTKRPGSNSVFSGFTAIGGGGGSSDSDVGQNGGSGGGGGGGYATLGGLGTTGQGNNGGRGWAYSGVSYTGGGGGGAGGVGFAGGPTTATGGDGGIGIQSAITGVSLYYAGGGGGGGYTTGDPIGVGGLGGGGDGSNGSGPNPTPGTANTGGGGGGGAWGNTPSGAGGSGVVILKYPNTSTISNTGGGLTFTTATVGGFNVTTFTAGTGSIQFSGPGISASSNDLTSGETLTINLRTEDTADNTTIAYTITGVDSGDINGSALSGNFTIVDNTASVSFLITTAAKKTLVFTSNGFTETVALIENRYGLAFLPGDNNQSFTSISYPQLVDISDRYDLTDISILSSIEQFEFSTQPVEFVTSYTASDAANIIDLSTSTADLLNITILQTNDLYKHDARSGDSVLVDNKILYSPDLVSIVLFNVPEPIPLSFPERWAG